MSAQDGLTTEQKQEIYGLIQNRANEVDTRLRRLAFRMLWKAAKSPFGVVNYGDIPTTGYADALVAVESVNLQELTPDILPTLAMNELRHKKWTPQTRAVLADQMVGFLEDMESMGVACSGAVFLWKCAYRHAVKGHESERLTEGSYQLGLIPEELEVA